jgi:hypothetical protein
MFNELDTNCTIFDGSSFSNGPNTKVQHMYGAMVTFFDGSPMILGGWKGFGEDQNEVEILKMGANSSWSSMPPMLKPLRLFSAVAVDLGPGHQTVWVFGGITGPDDVGHSSTFYFRQNSWTPGPDLLRPRHGHRTIKYAINELPVLLHIGGDIVKNDTLPVESFDIHTTNSHDLDLSLNFYTDFPEVFYVPNNICA